MESVILQLPVALTLYGFALFLCLFDRHYKASNGVVTLIATALAVGTTAYAIIMGTPFTECAAVLMIFALLNMGVKE